VGPPEIEAARVARLLAWGDECWRQRSARSLLERLRLRRAYKERSSDPEPAGTFAVHAIGKVTEERHTAALALVDELIAMSAPTGTQPAGVPDELAISG
jgi:hypothetical protein